MNETTATATQLSSSEVLGEVVDGLLAGTSDLTQALRSVADVSTRQRTAPLEEAQGFLETLAFIRDTMSEERLREAILNTVRSLRKDFASLPWSVVAGLRGIEINPTNGVPEFLIRAIQRIGPSLRISKDEMSAWVRISLNDAPLFTPESIVSNLRERGIVFGVDQNAIADLFASSRFEEEVLIAQGRPPEVGRDGYIAYDHRIQERSRTPKLLAGGKVSFKDIDLVAFVKADETLGVRIPSTPGAPGNSVTGRTIQSLPTTEAELPSCENTHVSDGGDRLHAAMDGCVWLQDGSLRFEPSLHIRGNVSYETGNIDSQVTVLIDGDVPSGFSVRSEQDISVGVTVEAATLEAKGSILVKGGIEGNDRGTVEANGDVLARFISNANITTLQNVVVASGIVQSTIWAGGSITLSGREGQIVGGTIDANVDIVANIIGSNMGVETIIRLGGKLDDLKNLIEETAGKISEHEQAAEQCTRIIEILTDRIAQSSEGDSNLDAALEKARAARKEASQNLAELESELNDLERQYDEELRTPRTVRARRNIMPGTIIQIQDAELAIKSPTGPATIAKSGDELMVLPFKEWDS